MNPGLGLDTLDPLPMNRVDFMLNLAGLLLWLEWRAVRLGAPLAAAGSISAVLKH
ncbi:MAG: hypothetical protein GYA76_19360, partial [Verrucomicrobia bacterium]|nr:hypothetical protein [Verrucomicrobiota bacterium]